ncbi:hypothetical protein HMN09_00076300 [Mycena chlorophos]|uniref:Uncharacterized protein n=1 Tax=Mycena chlorophos TaxID=658473 RepID=A0A8H6WMM5_MYCCL|nr:hypothetical protein HMN09_00076300 [Mycena chlorophos]
MNLQTPVASPSVDATVLKFTMASSKVNAGPYTLPSPTNLPYVPSLSALCLMTLARYPDQIDMGNLRLNYRQPTDDDDYDLLRSLIPFLDDPGFNWALVDPRLWVTLVSIYDGLPPLFRSYTVPLSDPHLPMLQRPSTPHFSLITILELPGCRELTDTSIVELKQLHSLFAVDFSETRLSSQGFKVLARTVLWDEHGQPKGPWGLRIFRCRNCKAIDDAILPHLSAFPLLFALDLRGTRCHSKTFLPTFQPAPEDQHSLYHPTPLYAIVDPLRSRESMFSSPNVFVLRINALYYAPTTADRPPTHKRPVEDVCVTFNPRSSEYVVQSSASLTKEPPRKRFRRRRTGFHNHHDCDCIDCARTPAGLDPQWALQNEIAGQEMMSQAAEQRLASFYGITPSGEGISRRYTSQPHEYPSSDTQSSDSDRLLMLYRPHPPWNVFADLRPPAATTPAAPAPEVAVPKRRTAEMANFAEQILEKRRKLQQDMAPSSALSAPVLPSNPFRKKPKDPVEASAPQVPLPETPSPRPLKPIMSIATPVLPKGVAPTSGSISKLRQKKSGAFNWTQWGKKS